MDGYPADERRSVPRYAKMKYMTERDGLAPNLLWGNLYQERSLRRPLHSLEAANDAEDAKPGPYGNVEHLPDAVLSSPYTTGYPGRPAWRKLLRNRSIL